MVKTIK